MAKYWFRRRAGLFSKDLGWGWVPISKEGWYVVIGFLLFVFWTTYELLNSSLPENTQVILLLLAIFLSIGIVCVICYSKEVKQEVFKDDSKKRLV